MSTDKQIIEYSLFRYLAQRSTYLARVNGIPAPSVRRILGELVAEGKAKFVAKDLFGYPGYLTTRTRQQARHA